MIAALFLWRAVMGWRRGSVRFLRVFGGGLEPPGPVSYLRLCSVVVILSGAVCREGSLQLSCLMHRSFSPHRTRASG